LKDHLISDGFQSGYTLWIRHREPKEYVGNVASGIDVQEELGAENNIDSGIDVWEELRCRNIEIDVQNLDDDQYCINDNLDEMMHDVEPEFADIPEMFETLGKEMSISLYPGTKLIKTITIFKLYNLKAKNGWSDKSFTSLLELLKEILPENNEIPDSTYKAKKILCPLMMEAKRILVWATIADSWWNHGRKGKLLSYPTLRSDVPAARWFVKLIGSLIIVSILYNLFNNWLSFPRWNSVHANFSHWFVPCVWQGHANLPNAANHEWNHESIHGWLGLHADHADLVLVSNFKITISIVNNNLFHYLQEI
jgi:hypothetical protein